MGIPCIEPSAGPYLLIAETCRTTPVLFKSILESWCSLNCSGKWAVKIVVPSGSDDAPEGMELTFQIVDDLMLFMMSSEYSYMGNPQPSRPV